MAEGKDSKTKENVSVVEDKDRIDVLLAEYLNQNEWERHNENQRAQLAIVLLAVSAALVALVPTERALTPADWVMPSFLAAIGILGVLAVTKYWERFQYHIRIEEAHREALDMYLQGNLLKQTRENGLSNHSKGFRPYLKDSYFKQHWIWQLIFALIAVLGCYYLLTAIS